MSQCCHQVYTGNAWAVNPYRQCVKTAKYEHEGKPYCGTHNPPNVEARSKKNSDRLKAERDASAEKARQFRIESDIKQWCADWVAECHPDEYANIKRRAEEQPR